MAKFSFEVDEKNNEDFRVEVKIFTSFQRNFGYKLFDKISLCTLHCISHKMLGTDIYVWTK